MQFLSGSLVEKNALAVLSVYGKLVFKYVSEIMCEDVQGIGCCVIESIRCGLLLVMNVRVA